jgi:hypothetical protein
MSYTSPPRPGEGPIPKFVWIKSPPDPSRNGSTGGCYGCGFRKQSHLPKDQQVRCSRIPCHVPANKGKVAKLINETSP